MLKQHYYLINYISINPINPINPIYQVLLSNNIFYIILYII